MYILRAFVFLAFLAQVLVAQQPTPILPDPNLTPGSAFDVTAQDVCTPGYAKKVRNVPEEMKREVYREYGITSHGPGDYEIDHLISLELGGSNSIKNLWPESHRTSPWNAQVKDRLEDKLHELVCSGQLDLKTAQQAIASNWIEAYKKYVSPNSPISGADVGQRAGGCGYSRPSLGEYQEREVLEARVALLWHNQTGPIHVRRRSSPEGLSAGERYRRMTMTVNQKLTHIVNSMPRNS